jgi:superfamily II DNA/RNA helicase
MVYLAGTGKTAAFILPILNKLTDNIIQALIHSHSPRQEVGDLIKNNYFSR